MPILIQLYDTANFFFNTDNITWSRFTESVNDGDIVTYTTTQKYCSNASRHILVLLESPEITPEDYQYVQDNYNKYDIIFTFHKKLLDLNLDMIYYNSCARTFLDKNDHQVFKKNKKGSMILSEKKYTSGQILRHQIADSIARQGLNVDLYGNSYKTLPNKTLGLRDYMFTIVIENCKEDYYFTEKLIDCFLSGTIPIYWGCPSIHNFFDKDGILQFNTVEECVQILKNITEDDYFKRLSIVNANFKTALQYTDDMTIDIRLLESIVL